MALHISSQFNQELESVRTEVMRMGGLVEQQLEQTLSALPAADAALLQKVADTDQQVNEMELAIDDQCQLIIARRQPAAGDLRLVLTVTRIITDLERMGDEVKKIALYGVTLTEQQHTLPRQFAELQRLGRHAQNMIRQALDAFARLDATTVVALQQADDELDYGYDVLLRQQITYMMEDARSISTGLSLLFMCKAIERIGDHALNVSEHVVYLAKGIDIRHAPLEKVQTLAVDEAAALPNRSLSNEQPQ